MKNQFDIETRNELMVKHKNRIVATYERDKLIVEAKLRHDTSVIRELNNAKLRHDMSLARLKFDRDMAIADLSLNYGNIPMEH